MAGRAMTVRLANALGGARAAEALVPGNGQFLRWYQCGPTVYDSAHVGHARSYVTFDVLRRSLTDVFGVPVQLAMGVTDVDDKILARAAAEGCAPQALARRFEAEFWADMRALNVRAPSRRLRVTEHMDAIVAFVRELLARGHAYEAADGVYFAIDRYPFEYEVFGRGRSATRRDFCLWKRAAAGDGSDGAAWDSPWGAGRPGWHIECSAVSRVALGDTFDLHTGGVDLQFPHHTNEVAQSCARNGAAPWVSVFAHTGHVHIEGRKMSKSLKNFVRVRDMLADFSADEFRMFCALHPYAKDVEWSADAMAEARALLARVQGDILDAGAGAASGDEDDMRVELAVRERLADDFDARGAVLLLADEAGPELKRVMLRKLGFRLLGGGGGGGDGGGGDSGALLDELVALRAGVRSHVRDPAALYRLCDETRARLADKGIQLRDREA